MKSRKTAFYFKLFVPDPMRYKNCTSKFRQEAEIFNYFILFSQWSFWRRTDFSFSAGFDSYKI